MIRWGLELKVDAAILSVRIWELPKIRGALFGGPYNKDPTNLGYYVAVPSFRKLPYLC